MRTRRNGSIVYVLVFMASLVASHCLAVDQTTEPSPEPKLVQRLFQDVLQTLETENEASARLESCINFADLIHTEGDRRKLIHIAKNAIASMPWDLVARYPSGKMPELLPLILSRCPDQSARDLVRVAYIATSVDPWSESCQSVISDIESADMTQRAMRKVASSWESSAPFDVGARFWRSELQRERDEKKPSFEWYEFVAFVSKYGRTDTQSMCDLLDQSLDARRAQESYGQLLRATHQDSKRRDALIARATANLVTVLERLAEQAGREPLSDQQRYSLLSTLRSIAMDRPDIALEVIDEHIIPAVKRGQLPATAIASSILSGTDAFAARLAAVKHASWRRVGSDLSFQPSEQDFIMAAVDIAPKPILDWLETTAKTALRDSILITGFTYSEPVDDELIERWIRLVERVSDPQQRRVAKYRVRMALRHLDMPPERKQQHQKRVQPEPFKSGEALVKFLFEEFPSRQKYAHVPIFLARFAVSPHPIQVRAMEVELGLSGQKRKIPFRDLMHACTLEAPAKLRLLQAALRAMPNEAVAIASIARHIDLKWAMQILWRTLPANRGPGEPRMRCMDLTEVRDSAEACEVLGLEYGAVKTYRDVPDVSAVISDFIDQVPEVDRGSLREGLFELFLDQYRFDEAYQQIQFFASPQRRLRLLRRMLTHSRSHYE